jgi:glycosyltransferase involved in cell wall biosynthesis
VTPRIAVIVASHDEGDLLREAVRSIEEPEPLELVVVDDASTDPRTLEVLAELEHDGVRVLRNQENVGPGRTRNTGVAATTAPYVFQLDADDLAVPGALSRMADLLDANPDAAFCAGDYEEFGQREAVNMVSHDLDPFQIAYRNQFGPALMRRSALEAVGGWVAEIPPGSDILDPARHGYENWHVWMAFAERGERGVHAGPGYITYRYRLASGRRLSGARRRNRDLYRSLRALHPALFADIREHRRQSELGGLTKRLYPFLYGGRRRYAIEFKLLDMLTRAHLPSPRRRPR